MYQNQISLALEILVCFYQNGLSNQPCLALLYTICCEHARLITLCLSPPNSHMECVQEVLPDFVDFVDLVAVLSGFWMFRNSWKILNVVDYIV